MEKAEREETQDSSGKLALDIFGGFLLLVFVMILSIATGWAGTAQ